MNDLKVLYTAEASVEIPIEKESENFTEELYDEYNHTPYVKEEPVLTVGYPNVEEEPVATVEDPD